MTKRSVGAMYFPYGSDDEDNDEQGTPLFAEPPNLNFLFSSTSETSAMVRHARYYESEDEDEEQEENSEDLNTTVSNATSTVKSNSDTLQLDAAVEVDYVHGFNWQKDGSPKTVKSAPGKQRIWFHCSSKKKTNCKARYYVDCDANSKEAIKPQHKESAPHNHPPPSRLRLSPLVKKDIDVRLSHQQKVGNIHKAIVNSTENPTSNTVPSRRQISNRKAYLKQQLFPSGDAIKNIIDRWGSTFVSKVELYPHVNIILCPPSAAKHFAMYGEFILLDGTFNLVEQGLVLLTFMVIIHSHGHPAAWALTNNESADNYFSICQHVKSVTKCEMKPYYILADYDAGLRSGVGAAFPGAEVLGDCFHFLQACVRRARQLNSKKTANDEEGEIEIPVLVNYLRILWSSPSVGEFNQNYNRFYDFYISRSPPFANYFQKYWIQTIPPSAWAKYNRGPDVPSGDQLIEAFHNRLEQLYRKDTKKEALDHFVAFLYEEHTYQEKVITNPVLFEERLRERELSVQKIQKGRVTLGDYVSAQKDNKKQHLSNIVDIPSLQISSSTPPSVPVITSVPSPTLNLTPTPPSQVTPTTLSAGLPSSAPFAPPMLPSSPPSFPGAVPVSKFAHAPTLSAPSPFAPPVTTPALRSIHQIGQCSCGRRPSNKLCSLKMCQACCSTDIRPCTVATHATAKMEASPYFKQISDAIHQNTRILLGYAHGSTPGRKRIVRPLRWRKEKSATKFVALCEESQIEKDYFITLVESVEPA